MSTTYRTTTGDTFDLISRKSYGTETEATRIARANPGVSEPLIAGLELTIPDSPGTPSDLAAHSPAADENEVALLIDGERFRFWSNIRITRSIDAMDSVDFAAPFDADAPGFRERFRPLSFVGMSVTVGGVPLFSGTMVAVNPALDNTQKTINVSGYSLPGVLNDCTAPASAYPIEFDGQGLREIAATVAGWFGLSLDFRGEQGAIFDRVDMAPGKPALSFLASLAAQRTLVLSSNPAGGLLIWQSIATGSPVAVLIQGEGPVVSVAPSIRPQSYYSDITGLEPVVIGRQGSKYTARNSRLSGVVRPTTFTVPDTTGGTVKEVVDAKLGRMFGNMVSYSLRVNTWRDPSGELWAPNTTLKLTAPDAMIYTPYEFIIRSVEFVRDSASETATLTLVLPGAFSGQIPEALPWD